jgi:hypothetical protein
MDFNLTPIRVKFQDSVFLFVILMIKTFGKPMVIMPPGPVEVGCLNKYLGKWEGKDNAIIRWKFCMVAHGKFI